MTFFQSLKAYVGFDAEAAALLAAAYPAVRPHFPAIVDEFYAAIAADPGARAAITGGEAQLGRLKQTLRAWIEEVFRGPHDEAYFERRCRIGHAHVRIDLPQSYMLTAMNRIRLRTAEALAVSLPPAAVAPTTAALHRILDLDLAIMLETYREDLLARNRAAERLATIGELAAGIGHELRNPLGVMDSSLFILRQRLVQLGVDDPGVLRHLDKIGREIQQSVRTIDELFELARSRSSGGRHLAEAQERDRPR